MLTNMIPLCGISNRYEKCRTLAFFGVKLSTSPRSSLCCEWLEVLFTLPPFQGRYFVFQKLPLMVVRAFLPLIR